jgi:hypothetical protein
MAAPPKFTSLRIEDYKDAPQWIEPLFRVLNDVLLAVADALDAKITRTENLHANEKIGATFIGGSPLEIDFSLDTRPKHVVVTKLERVDGLALSAAWSNTWGLSQQGRIVLAFQGLTASVKYSCSVTYE